LDHPPGGQIKTIPPQGKHVEKRKSELLVALPNDVEVALQSPPTRSKTYETSTAKVLAAVKRASGSKKRPLILKPGAFDDADTSDDEPRSKKQARQSAYAGGSLLKDTSRRTLLTNSASFRTSGRATSGGTMDEWELEPGRIRGSIQAAGDDAGIEESTFQLQAIFSCPLLKPLVLIECAHRHSVLLQVHQ
jgi:hypothetical protein